MRKLFFTILFLFFLSCNLFAQVTFTGKAPSSAYVGEGFTLRYTINSNERPSNFEIPSISGGRIISGPYQGQSSSTTIINGNVTSSSSYTFSIVVRADKAGKVNVSPARIKAGGKIYTSQSFNIDVLDRNSAANNNRSYGNYQGNNTYSGRYRNTSPSSQNTSVNIDNQALFIRAIPNKTNVIKGEEVVISYKLYTLLPVSEYSIQKIPSSAGFWVEELDRQERPTLSIEEYNGQRYQVAILKKEIVYPQRSGSLTIQGMTINVVAHVEVHSQRQISTGDPFFDRFLNDPFFASATRSFRPVKKTLKTNPITINVKELPHPQPENYIGGVGDFKISSSISSQKVKAFDAFYLTYTIEGKGNISLINALPLPTVDEFQISDPEITDNIARTGSGLSGARTFKYLVIPSVEGDYTIPELQVSYFDLNTGEYKTLTTEAYNIHVDKGDVSNAYAKQLDERAKYRNMTVIPYQQMHSNGKEVHIFDRVFTFILPLIILFLTFIGIYVYSKYLVSLSDVVATKRRRATRIAVKRLGKAKKLLKLKNYEAFEDETALALRTYLLDRFKIKTSDFTIESCTEKLLSEGISKETTDNLASIFNRCQYIRFSPDKQTDADETIYNDTINVITSMEEEMKLSKKNTVVNNKMPFFILALLLSFSVFAASNQKTETKSDLCKKAETYFNKSDYANAMLYYEKALKLSPNDTQVRLNIKIVRSRLMGDCYIMPDFLPLRAAKYVSGVFSLTFWFVIMLILFVASCLTFFLYRFSEERKVLWFYICLSCFLLSLFSMGFGCIRQGIQNDNDNAIVMKSNIKLKTSMNDSSKDVLTLYKGQKIRIMQESSSKWLKVRTEDRREGYINTKEYKRI